MSPWATRPRSRSSSAGPTARLSTPTTSTPTASRSSASTSATGTGRASRWST
jgi:hypothetical protein